jgi:hypothetical protein
MPPPVRVVYIPVASAGESGFVNTKADELLITTSSEMVGGMFFFL